MNETVILETLCGCSRRYHIKNYENVIRLNLLLRVGKKNISYIRVFEYNNNRKNGYRVFTEVLMAN